MKRIKQISIKNLFGIFHHEIMLNMNERVTIIHSPNGFGKTAILKLLNELFTQGTRALRTTPFDELSIYFEDQTHLQIEKKLVKVATSSKIRRRQIMFHYFDSAGNIDFVGDLTEEIMTEEVMEAKLHAEMWSLQQALQRTLQTEDTNDNDYEERISNLTKRLSYQERALAAMRTRTNMPEKAQNRLQGIRESIPIRFIETQRLLNLTAEARNQSSVRQPAMSPAVTLYSEELSKTLTDKLADSTTLTQSLDRTFPSRLVDMASKQSDISESELREKLAELEAKRKSLMAVGLVDQNANDAVLAADRIDSSTKAVLSLYVEDTRQKLAVFNDIAPKIELLTQIINKRFLYKEMSISRKDGFVFTTPKGTRLALDQLSSGEQHELILFYELLFKALPGSLIMIDEPEISLHVVWQEQFLQDVQDITRLADVDVLIATHSPDIIDGHRDLVVELEGPKDGGL